MTSSSVSRPDLLWAIMGLLTLIGRILMIGEMKSLRWLMNAFS